jgi:hypothetical protein
MKTSKLVIGIVSIVLALVVLFQSCAAGLGSALANNQDSSGGTGVFVAILYIVAGIVGIAARKSKGGAIAATILYAITGIIGVTATGMFKDLLVWGVIAFIFAVVFAISIFTQDYSRPEPPKQEQQ